MKPKKLKFYQIILQEISTMQTQKFYAILAFLAFCITVYFLPQIGDFILLVKS